MLFFHRVFSECAGNNSLSGNSTGKGRQKFHYKLFDGSCTLSTSYGNIENFRRKIRSPCSQLRISSRDILLYTVFHVLRTLATIGNGATLTTTSNSRSFHASYCSSYVHITSSELVFTKSQTKSKFTGHTAHNWIIYRTHSRSAYEIQIGTEAMPWTKEYKWRLWVQRSPHGWLCNHNVYGWIAKSSNHADYFISVLER